MDPTQVQLLAGGRRLRFAGPPELAPVSASTVTQPSLEHGDADTAGREYAGPWLLFGRC